MGWCGVVCAEVRVAYLTSRFPHVSETFIVREMDAVAAEGIEVLPRALFAAVDPTVHERARPWMAALRRPTPVRGVLALAWWLTRRPGALLPALGTVVRSHARSPGLLARALATVPIAAAHARELEASKVDHVHAHYATYPALAAWLIQRLTGIPYSFTAHAHDIYVHRLMLGRKVAEARFVVTISDFNHRLLTQAGGTPVEVVHCGVPVDSIACRPRTLPTEGPVQVLCVASLQEYKGHAILLDALAMGGLERLRVECVGSGPLRSDLKARAAALGLSDRVTFSGPQPEHEVAARFAAADAFVLPSIVAADGQMEGLPVVLMEALAHGVPAVSTRLSGIPELVRDGETGLLATPGDPVSLHDALMRLLAEPSGAAERALAGRALVEDEFDLRRCGAQIAALLRH